MNKIQQYRSSSTELVLSRKKEKKKDINQNKITARISD